VLVISTAEPAAARGVVSAAEMATAWAEVVEHDRVRFEVPDPISFADGGPDGSAWVGPWAAQGRVARTIEVPRRSGGVRVLALLDPAVHSRYRALVTRVGTDVERLLGPGVLAGRCRPVRGTGFHLEPWRRAWPRYLRLVHEMARREEPLLHADIRDCFASIRPNVVTDALRALGASPEDVRGIGRLLDRFERDGVRGLPVGPEPSAVLANAVLASVDRTLAGEGLSHVRWVDDVVLEPRADPAAALEAFRAGAAAVGLRAAEEKCREVGPRRGAVPSGAPAVGPARVPIDEGSLGPHDDGSFWPDDRGSLERADAVGDAHDPFLARRLVAGVAAGPAAGTAGGRRLLRHIRRRHRELAPLAAWGLGR